MYVLKSYWIFRQRAAGLRVQVKQGDDDRSRASKALPAPDANAELPASIQVPLSGSLTIFLRLPSYGMHYSYHIVKMIFTVATHGS